MFEFTPSAAFFVSTGLLQLAFAAILLMQARTDRLSAVLGLLFAINAGLALLKGANFLGLANATETVAETAEFAVARTVWVFDMVTNFLIVYFALVYPRPVRVLESKPAVGYVGLGLVLAGLLVAFFVDNRVESHLALEPGSPGWTRIHASIYYVLTNLAFPVLLLRWAFLLPEIKNPATLRQFKLLFAAFAVRAAHMIGLWGTVQVGDGLDSTYWFDKSGTALLLAVTRVVTGALTIAALIVAVSHLVRVRNRRPTENQAAINFVLLFIFFGLLEAAMGVLSLRPLQGDWAALVVHPLTHVDLLVIRPVLVWAAVVRYQFLNLSVRGPLPLQAISFALATPALYGGMIPLVGLDSEPSAAIHVTAGAVAVAGGFLVAIAVRPLGQSPADGNAGSTNTQAEADFIAAVEDMYRRGAQTSEERNSLDLLRRRLGLSPERAEALEEIVQTFWSRMHDLVDWRVGDRVLGRYRIDEVLGRGAMSHTYRCFDELMEQDVVLKRQLNLDESSVAAIHQEGRTLSNLNHPNIVRLLRTESAGDESILVLEYMAGGSLEDVLVTGPVPEGTLVDYTRSLLSALEQAHRHGVIHRDIKPSNILFDAEGRAKLADFGIARQHRATNTLVVMTQGATRLMGSFRYMAPEQIDTGLTSSQSDLFSLGAVLLDCIRASGDDEGETADAGRHPRTSVNRAIDGAPQSLKPLLKALLEPDPKKRAASATKAAALLPSPAGTPAGSGRRQSRRRNAKDASRHPRSRSS